MIERLNPSLRSGSPAPPRSTQDSSSSSPYSSSNPYYSRGTDPLLPSAYDLLERMLLPDMTKRITARDALFHPFLVETLPAASRSPANEEDTNSNMFDMSDGAAADGGECVLESREVEDPETGEMIVARGDDLYVPHPVGEGICKKGHWVDDETGEPCCFEVVDDGTRSKGRRTKPKTDENKLSAKAKREHARRERIARERECGVYRLHVGPTGNLVDVDQQADALSETRVVKVRLRRLESGEGIAIGLDPCEFHRNGVVDASFYETHVQALQAEMEEDDVYADVDGRETDGMYSDDD